MTERWDGTGDLLLVCRANLLRSPLAALMLRQALDVRGRVDLAVSSAGLAVVPGAEIGAELLSAVGAHGPGLSARVPVPLTADLLGRAALVLTMTERQRDVVVRMTSARVPRTFTLREFDRLSARGEWAAPRNWEELAQRAHASRARVPPADGPEDVVDPVGGSARELRRTAEALLALTGRMAGRFSPRPDRSG